MGPRELDHDQGRSGGGRDLRSREGPAARLSEGQPLGRRRGLDDVGWVPEELPDGVVAAVQTVRRRNDPIQERAVGLADDGRSVLVDAFDLNGSGTFTLTFDARVDPLLSAPRTFAESIAWLMYRSDRRYFRRIAWQGDRERSN